MSLVFLTSAVLSLVPASHAAVEQANPRRENVLMALHLPLSNRYQVLSETIEEDHQILEDLVFDSHQSLGVRWKSLTLLALTRKGKSVKALERALESREWFLRNAGMVAIVHADEKKALKWAEKLLDDPALVVRSAAVGAIRKLETREKNSHLWEKLYSKQNFRKKQSLWIRRQIVETLSELAARGEEHRFIQVLSDPDKSLHLPALEALEKITGIQSRGKLVSERIDFWLQWWEINQRTSNIRI